MDNNLNPFLIDSSDSGKPVAILFLYSPRIYGTQVLRPYVYSFSNEAVDKLLGAAPTMTEAFRRPDIASTEEVASCIKPDACGIGLNMDVASMMWTFLLFVRQPNNYNGVALKANGFNTAIMTGQCLDEPVGPMGSINPDCRLMVHSRQVMNARTIGSSMGARLDAKVLTADDIIDPSMNMLATNQDLYLTTPFTVMENCDDDGAGNMVTTEATVALTALNRSSVPVALKTPGVHMNQILNGLDIQNKESASAEYAPSGLSGLDTMMPADDIDAYRTGFTNKMSQMTMGCPVQNGIDVTNLFSIGELDTLYNGGLKVKIQSVSPTAQYEVVPQDLQNPKVAYSSFIGSSIVGLAMDTGLSSISFMYTSHDPLKANDLVKSTFQVIPDDTYLAVPPNDPMLLRQMLSSAVQMFQTMFEKNVAMFITPVVGNFTVMVRYSNTGECQINLQLDDYDMNTNLSADGWIEAPMRMGSVTTTSVGGLGTFKGNGHVLNKLVLLTQGKTQYGSFVGGPSTPIDQAEPEIPDYSSVETPAASSPNYRAGDLSF